MKLKSLIIFLATFAATSLYSQEYRIESKAVSFVITHPMKSVEGQCPDVTIENFSAKREGTTITVNGPFVVRIKIQTMTTGNRNRDSNMLDTLQYPQNREIVFRAERTQITQNTAQIQGSLSLNGHSLALTVPATVSSSGDSIAVDGEFQVKFSDFGLERPRLLLLSLEDTVTIKFHFSLGQAK